MVDVKQNILPQAGILNNEENSAIDSDRVKAPVVVGGPTDWGGGGGAEARFGSGWCSRVGSLSPYRISEDE